MVEINQEMNQMLKVCITTARGIGNEATCGFTHNRLDKFTVDWVEDQLALLEEWTRDVPQIGHMVKEILEKFCEIAREPEQSTMLVLNRTWAWLWGCMDTLEYALTFLLEVDA